MNFSSLWYCKERRKMILDKVVDAIGNYSIVVHDGKLTAVKKLTGWSDWYDLEPEKVARYGDFVVMKKGATYPVNYWISWSPSWYPSMINTFGLKIEGFFVNDNVPVYLLSRKDKVEFFGERYIDSFLAYYIKAHDKQLETYLSFGFNTIFFGMLQKFATGFDTLGYWTRYYIWEPREVLNLPNDGTPTHVGRRRFGLNWFIFGGVTTKRTFNVHASPGIYPRLIATKTMGNYADFIYNLTRLDLSQQIDIIQHVKKGRTVMLVVETPQFTLLYAPNYPLRLMRSVGNTTTWYFVVFNRGNDIEYRTPVEQLILEHVPLRDAVKLKLVSGMGNRIADEEDMEKFLTADAEMKGLLAGLESEKKRTLRFYFY